MANQQMLEYIKQQLRQGVTQEKIKSSLLAKGWQEKDIEETINLAKQPEQLAVEVPSTKTSKKPMAVIIAVVLGVLILGGGSVFGYYEYFSPERIIQKMTKRMVEVKSLEYSGQITAGIETDNFAAISSLENSGLLEQPEQPAPTKQQSGNFSIDFSGASDLIDLNEPKAMFEFDINTDMLPQSFRLEARAVGDVVYFKINNVPDLGIFHLSFLENQWVKIDPEAIKEQFGLTEQQIEEAQKEQELSPEQIEQIKDIATSTKILKISEKLASEKINGVNTHHYKFVIDKEGLVQLITEISEVIENKTLTEEELQELEEPLQATEMPGGEIWIGKKDLLLYKISMDLNIKETEKAKSEGQVTFSAQFKNYNKPVQVVIPEPVKTLEEIMGELMGGTLLQGFEQNIQMPSQQWPDEEIDFYKDSDNNGVPDELEEMYGPEPGNLMMEMN